MICFCERKLENHFELHFVTYIRFFFGHCFVTFSYKVVPSFFEHCHVTFPYKDPVSFFGTFVEKLIVSCFSDSFIQKTTQQSKISCLVTSDSQLSNYSRNSLFTLQKKYEKNIVSKEYCIASHDDKMCFLPNCRHHIILIGNIEELLQKLDAFCFNYQHVVWLYALFKYRFIDKIVVKRRVDKFLLMCRGQFFSTSKTKERTEKPGSSKNESWGRKYKKTLVELLPNNQVDAN